MQSNPVTQNFMITDLVLFLIAFFGFGLQVLASGYLIGWFSNLLSFRQRRFATRLLMSLVFSVAATPTLSYWIGKTTSLAFVAWGSLIAVLIFAWLIIREHRHIQKTNAGPLVTLLILLLLWFSVALLSLVDIQIGKRVYFSSIAFDYQTRNLLTDAIFRTGIPPANPHIYPGEPTPVHYYYFWYILPATLCELTKGWIDPRSSFNAGTIWAGLSLAAIVMLYLRLHTPDNQRHIMSRSIGALGLLAITGLDIIFAATYIFRFLGIPDIFESWNGNSAIASWIVATLWVPHHVASLVACFAGFLIFQSINPQSSRRYRFMAALMGALSLASAAGMSIYVTLVFAVFWTAWLIVCTARKEYRYKVIPLIAMGGLALLFDFPYLLDLIFQNQEVAGSTGLLNFWVRPIQPLQWLFSQWGLNQFTTNAAHLLLLPFNYLIELGFFLLAGIIYFHKSIKDKANSPYLLPESFLLFTSFGISSFVYSNTATTNDLGWRTIMPVQFILLIWSINILPAVLPNRFSWTSGINTQSLSSVMRTFLISLIVMGFLGNVFAVTYQRVFFINADRSGLSHSPEGIPSTWQYGERLYNLRQAVSFINQKTPQDAVILSNPGWEELFLGVNVYLHRQTLASAPYFIANYGIPEQEYQSLEALTLPIFQNSTLSFAQASDICHQLGIDYLLVKDLDPVWKNPQSWIWIQQPLFSNSYFRIFECSE